MDIVNEMEIFITLNKYKTRQSVKKVNYCWRWLQSQQITLFVARPTKPTAMAQGLF